MKVFCNFMVAIDEHFGMSELSIVVASGCNFTCLLALETDKQVVGLIAVDSMHARLNFCSFCLFYLCPDCHYVPLGHHGIEQTSHGGLVYLCS